MKLQKNKKKEKVITAPTPVVQAEVIPQENGKIKETASAAGRTPHPCVVFKEGFHIPNLKGHATMKEMMAQPKMAMATGYQEDGTLNISVVEQDTFPDFLLKYSMQHGCAECLESLKGADTTVAATAVAATRTVIFSALTSKINSVIHVAMSQAKKVIVDELAKYSEDIYKEVSEALSSNDVVKYGMSQPLYPGDVSVNSNGGPHSIGNVIANCKPSDENVDAVKKAVSMWIDNYVIKEYESIMQIIMSKLYSSSLDIVQADGIYASIEEFACEAFKCYATPIHNSLDEFAQDIIFAQMCAYPNAKLRGYNYCIDDFDV